MNKVPSFPTCKEDSISKGKVCHSLCRKRNKKIFQSHPAKNKSKPDQIDRIYENHLTWVDNFSVEETPISSQKDEPTNKKVWNVLKRIFSTKTQEEQLEAMKQEHQRGLQKHEEAIRKVKKQCEEKEKVIAQSLQLTIQKFSEQPHAKSESYEESVD